MVNLLVWSLQQIEHLECGVDGGLCLVGIEGACAEDMFVLPPCDDRLHKCVSASARRYGHCIVDEVWQRTAHILLVYAAESLHEGVILSVASCIACLFLSIDRYLYGCYRLDAIG